MIARLAACSRVLALGLLALGLAACASPTPLESAAPAAPATSALALEQLPATMVAVREQVQQLAPAPRTLPPIGDDAFHDCAVALITRWEVGGPKAYTQRWQGVIWPGGISGPTWGIGYDGGHQTRTDIGRDWREHLAVASLQDTSGVTGAAAKRRLPEWREVRTAYPFARDVFVRASLPSYTAGARRLYGATHWDSLEAEGRCALVSNGYNRGFGTAGARRAEIRHRRDVCLPQRGPARLECIADSLLAEQRLWPASRGLRDRRADEARTVRRAVASGQVVAVGIATQLPDLPHVPSLPRRWRASL